MLIILLPLLFSLSARADMADHFPGQDGCFILENLKTGNDLSEYGGKFCEERVSPCSTFKIPIALMAIDQNLIQDENTPFKWDHQKRDLEVFNHDQTAQSWIKDSVVWVSQELTPKIGKTKIQKYLKDFDYGNQDFSGGITKAWLTSSLKISPREQVKFLRKLWKNELAVSPKALELTKKLTLGETSPKGAEIHGKTGSSPITKQGRLGWYVGYLKVKGEEYVFALNFKDTRKVQPKEYGGPEAREKVKQILSGMGLY